MNSTPTSQQMSTESPLVIHTGSLLSNLDQETQVRVLESRYMKSPLVEATEPFAKKVQERLNEVSYFDMKLCRFIRTKLTHGCKRLGPMGCTYSHGYILLSVCGFEMLQSHLVYLLFTGAFPQKNKEIDHIDGNPNNDHPGNLRLVSHKVNLRNCKLSRNNTSGYNNISVHKQTGKYIVYTTIAYKRIHIGFTETLEEAIIIRDNWFKAHPEHGFTYRHGT